MPTSEDEVPSKSIPLALQSLFFKVSPLQTHASCMLHLYMAAGHEHARDSKCACAAAAIRGPQRQHKEPDAELWLDDNGCLHAARCPGAEPHPQRQAGGQDEGRVPAASRSAQTPPHLASTQTRASCSLQLRLARKEGARLHLPTTQGCLVRQCQTSRWVKEGCSTAGHQGRGHHREAL